MAENNKYCPQCGAQNDQDAIFCVSCGTKFDRPKPGLGQDDVEQTSQSASPQPAMAEPYQTEPDFEAPEPTEDVNNIFEGSRRMLEDPRHYSLRLLADPDAPSATALVVVKVLLSGLLYYLTIVKDRYFDAIYREIAQEQANQLGIPLSEYRMTLRFTLPIGYMIFFFAFWYIGSWILGLLVKGGISDQSPLKVDVSYSMRQLNGYRQIPLIIGHIFGILIILLFGPTTFNILFQRVIQSLTWIGGALILWRGLGEYVGYRGSFHKILAGVIIGFSVLRILPVLI